MNPTRSYHPSSFILCVAPSSFILHPLLNPSSFILCREGIAFMASQIIDSAPPRGQRRPLPGTAAPSGPRAAVLVAGRRGGRGPRGPPHPSQRLPAADLDGLGAGLEAPVPGRTPRRPGRLPRPRRPPGGVAVFPRAWVRETGPLVAGAVGLMTAWDDGHALKTGWALEQTYYPGPDEVFGAVYEDRIILLSSAWHSLRLLLSGYACGVAAGLVTGVCVGWSPTVRYWAMPVIKSGRPDPGDGPRRAGDDHLEGFVLVRGRPDRVRRLVSDDHAHRLGHHGRPVVAPRRGPDARGGSGCT